MSIQLLLAVKLFHHLCNGKLFNGSFKIDDWQSDLPLLGLLFTIGENNFDLFKSEKKTFLPLLKRGIRLHSYSRYHQAHLVPFAHQLCAFPFQRRRSSRQSCQQEGKVTIEAHSLTTTRGELGYRRKRDVEIIHQKTRLDASLKIAQLQSWRIAGWWKISSPFKRTENKLRKVDLRVFILTRIVGI